MTNFKLQECSTKICRDTSYYYHNFKIKFGDQFEAKFGSQVGLTRVSVRIKVVMLVISKLDSRVDPQ